MADRRTFVRKASGLIVGWLAGRASADAQQTGVTTMPVKRLKLLMRGTWGTEDPTRAAFVFAHANVLADAGHDVRIFLTGDATNLMRRATVDAVKPIGWPPLAETMQKIVAHRIPVYS